MKRLFLNLIVSFGFITALPALSLYAQEEDTSIVDTTVKEISKKTPDNLIFNELRLSQNGVYAYDTLGERWRYDFDSDVFVPAEDQSEQAPEIVIDPVEKRCTEELKIEDYPRSSVLVGYDEYVDGDIVAYSRVTVKGWVKGSVQSISSSVVVTESGQVDGDVKAPEIVIRDGGVVLGRQIIATKIELPVEGIAYDFIVVIIALTAFFLLAGFLVVQLMPRQLENFQNCMCRHRVKTFLLGFIGSLVFPIVIAVLAVTIVGIIVVPVVPLLYIVAVAFGMISFGYTLGQKLASRFFHIEKGLLFQVLLGIVTVMVLWLLTSILMTAQNDVSFGFGVFFLVVSIIICTYPVFSGVGAALLTRLGFRQYVSFADKMQQQGAQMPAPPPIPQEPPIMTPPPVRPFIPENEPTPPRGPYPPNPPKSDKSDDDTPSGRGPLPADN
ncbi:MAG: polymer-forming cytoskeletal protein [Candidatus Zixiibacteriota bacterium]